MLFWTIVIIIAVWFIVKKTRTVHPSSPNSYNQEESFNTTNNPISEDTVYEAQNRFENKFSETYLPDSLGGHDIYMYKNLMSKWYNKLSGEHRYDEKMIQKIREDFLEYMYSVQQGKTSHYLYMELDEGEKSEGYREEADICYKKVRAIEDAFASLIGKDAVAELDRVRKFDFGDVDREGNLAPEGFQFDFTGELKKKEK
jgi:hypothetical protein